MVQSISNNPGSSELVANSSNHLNKANHIDSNYALALENANMYSLSLSQQDLTLEKTEASPSWMNQSVNLSDNSLNSITLQLKGSRVNGFDLDVPKVLVVDDHAASRMTAVALLAMEGYEVIEADSGSTAVELVNQKQLDLILLDVMMPGIDGFEVCHLLKQKEHIAQVFQMIDIYDALTSERPYKRPFTTEEALSVMAKETESGWRNPKLLKQFVEFITFYKDQHLYSNPK